MLGLGSHFRVFHQSGDFFQGQKTRQKNTAGVNIHAAKFPKVIRLIRPFVVRQKIFIFIRVRQPIKSFFDKRIHPF